MSSKRSTVRFERRGPNQILLLILRKYKECPVLQLEELNGFTQSKTYVVIFFS